MGNADEPADNEQDEIEYWVGESQRLSAQHDYAEALACIERALAIDSVDAFLWLEKCDILLEIERYDEALQAVDYALELDPEDALAWNDKGLALHLLGKAAQALQAFEHALTLDDDDPLLWRNLGETLLDPSLRQFQAAAEAFHHALALDDTYGLAWAGVGDAHWFQGQPEAALSAYDNAIKHRPDRPEGWAGRGNVLSDLGRYTEAAQSYARALALDPTDAAIQQHLTEVTRRLP